MINSGKENLKEQFKLNLQKDFLNFSKKNRIYYQIRYLNETGQEIVRINAHEGIFKIVLGNELQNKKERYYFQDTMKLKKGEVLISPLDLNIESGKIENQGSKENPIYIPVIRYATPVFDNFGNFKGIIIANIHTNNLLEKIQENNTLGNIFLINAKGFYLSNKNKNKEFEFMFNKTSTFFKDYSEEITTIILANKGQTYFETKNLIISFKYIYPAFRNLEIGKNEEINFQKIPLENHFWVLVIVLDKKVLRGKR